MPGRKKEPAKPVDRERAHQHAQLVVRRDWAGGVAGFEGWPAGEVNPEPLPLYDLNGELLFHEFEVREGDRVLGTVRASASETIGSPVVSVGMGPRRWDPDRAIREAEKRARKEHPRAEVEGSELVCYSYPKIGVRVDLKEGRTGVRSLLYDASDLQPVETFGPDELEGYTSWSFYNQIVAADSDRRLERFRLAQEELDAVRTKSAHAFASAFRESELSRLRTALVPSLDYGYISFYSSRVLKYGPRCSPHDCFELYAQKTNVYCAVATGQMILDFYRYPFSQDDIASAMGTGAGGTTNAGQVAGYHALTKNCMVATYDTSATWAEAKVEIDANRPVKSGIPGHARAVAGWKRQNIFLIGQPPKHWLQVYDPWPWNANICEGGGVSWEDWDAKFHTNFIYLRHRTTACS